MKSKVALHVLAFISGTLLITSILGYYRTIPAFLMVQSQNLLLLTSNLPLQAGKNGVSTNASSSCCEIASLHGVEELCSTREVVDRCTCADFLRCKLVIVTGLSENHFNESIDFFGSVHAQLPEVKIIVYDIGLFSWQVNAIQAYCNVQEVRKFNFDLYPEHTRVLDKFSWKVFLIEEVSKDYELFLYCDASCRITNQFVPFLPYILKFPTISLNRLYVSRTITRYTHQGMLDYLQIKQSRAELMKILPEGFQTCVLLIWGNDVFRQRILKPWVDCAEHAECISPPGAVRAPCDDKQPSTAYVGCHRYDQSALNMIIVKEYGEKLNRIFSENGIPSRRIVDIQRFRSNHYDSNASRKCNIMYRNVTSS